MEPAVGPHERRFSQFPFLHSHGTVHDRRNGRRVFLHIVCSDSCVFVLYDACHVRYYSGKNIELTQQLIKDLRDMTGLTFSDPIYQEKLKTILGHKVVEVIGGFVLGLLIPLLLSPLFLI